MEVIFLAPVSSTSHIRLYYQVWNSSSLAWKSGKFSHPERAQPYLVTCGYWRCCRWEEFLSFQQHNSSSAPLMHLVTFFLGFWEFFWYMEFFQSSNTISSSDFKVLHFCLLILSIPSRLAPYRIKWMHSWHCADGVQYRGILLFLSASVAEKQTEQRHKACTDSMAKNNPQAEVVTIQSIPLIAKKTAASNDPNTFVPACIATFTHNLSMHWPT